MSDPVDALVRDLLEWIGPAERPYREVIDAWRTSCPRLPVWETANSEGLLEHRRTAGGESTVALSAKGLRRLGASRAAPARASASTEPSAC